MKKHFTRIDGELCCEGVPLTELANRHGTPLFVYSLRTSRDVLAAYQSAFAKYNPVVAYAIKANPNLEILRELGRAGAGCDVVSGGELDRAVRAGIPGERIVFAGVGKSVGEMAEGLRRKILMFNVESKAELELLNATAISMGTKAPVAIRVNPDVDPRTHSYIATGKKESKFGLDIRTAIEAYRLAVDMKGIDPVGMHCHIGSQITSTNPFVEAAGKLVRVVKEARETGAAIRFLDFGGGLGIRYSEENPPTPAKLAEDIEPFIGQLDCRLVLEPGRSMIGAAGVLITRVHYVKDTPVTRYVIVDAAMNDLARPALYDAYHEVEHVGNAEGKDVARCDVVGPICETGDFLAKGRLIPVPAAGDLLCFCEAGAYGMAMSSNYNVRCRAAEVLVDGTRSKLVRRRETYEDILRPELEAENEWH